MEELHPSEPSYLYPNFITDHQGRVYCRAQKHPIVSNDEMTRKYWDSEIKLMSLYEFQCDKCINFQMDRCYLPRADVAHLLRDVNRGQYHCDICGGQIHQSFSVVNTVYNKQFLDSNPLLCCYCDSHIRKGDIDQLPLMQNYQNGAIFYSIVAIVVLIYGFYNLIETFLADISPFIALFMIAVGFFLLIQKVKRYKFVRQFIRQCRAKLTQWRLLSKDSPTLGIYGLYFPSMQVVPPAGYDFQFDVYNTLLNQVQFLMNVKHWDEAVAQWTKIEDLCQQQHWDAQACDAHLQGQLCKNEALNGKGK